MIKSKAWKWKLLNVKEKEHWTEPCFESFYLINRWLLNNKKDFLDLGCGLGRNAIQFAKAGFNTFAFDLRNKMVANGYFEYIVDLKDLKVFQGASPEV